MKWSLLLLATAFTYVSADVVQVDFDIYRGNSIDSIKNDKRNRDGAYLMQKRDSAEMTLQNEQTFYMVDIALGSNQNSQQVLIDTGSSDLWVMSSELTCLSATKRNLNAFDTFIKDKQIVNNEVELIIKREEPSKTVEEKGWGFFTTIFGTQTGSPAMATGNTAASNTCTQYGSFDTGDSDSFNRNSSAPDFEILYADGTSASGIWGTDTLVFGNTTVDNLSFAVANRTSSDVGVFGIGLPALEVTSEYGIEYANLPIKLRQQGIISKAAYSVYLGSSSAKTGTILFGGVDHAKYTGELTTVPIVSHTGSTINRLEAKVDSITVNSTSDSVVVTSNLYAANLDTGSTLSYFPSSLLSSLVSSLGGSQGTYSGYTVVNCPSSSETMEINFSGRIISVPLKELIVTSGSTCLLGVIEQSSTSSYILFGDNVLRRMYVVFDLDDLQISIAQASYSSDSDIESIGDSVPGAVSAADYSSTQLASSSTENTNTNALNDSTTYKVPKLLFISLIAVISGLVIF